MSTWKETKRRRKDKARREKEEAASQARMRERQQRADETERLHQEHVASAQREYLASIGATSAQVARAPADSWSPPSTAEPRRYNPMRRHLATSALAFLMMGLPPLSAQTDPDE